MKVLFIFFSLSFFFFDRQPENQHGINPMITLMNQNQNLNLKIVKIPKVVLYIHAMTMNKKEKTMMLNLMINHHYMMMFGQKIIFQILFI
jgi:hypothetical protein